MNKYLILDMSNILNKGYHALQKETSRSNNYISLDDDGDVDVDSEFQAMLYQYTLFHINEYATKYKATKLVMCFDKPNWRKQYTKSDKCLSGLVYKQHRDDKLSQAEKKKYNKFLEQIKVFEEFMETCTSAIVLYCDGFEADDLIYGVVEYLTLDDNNECVVISSDKDMMQLLRHDNVKLIEIKTGKERTLEEWDYDADFYVFEKCIRGDKSSDNIANIYPNLRRTKILEIYKDEYKRINFMKEPARIPTTKEDVTMGDLFNENKLLIDLYNQPEANQNIIMKTVIAGFKQNRKFNYFKFLQFIGKYSLKKLSSQSDKFIKILSL
jgi:5'-3' exonuclease